ncbi:MAG TPA: NPCBM/NEW2 domain-containing protein [Tepidisphaeraceae bacterium]|nr:NPCBM/NEW2 domain-containing protein [Tepidisphaeraceae bacterium]
MDQAPTLNHKARRKAVLCDAIERLEGRCMLAAHIVGDATVYSTIQSAVYAAAPGATINVDAGTYPELVKIDRPLTLRGAQAGVDARSNIRIAANSESILTGYTYSDGTRSGGFYINANDVTLDGFTVQGNTNATGSCPAGVVIAPKISGTHILDNIIRNNVTGLYLSNYSSTDPAIIEHNRFSNNNNPGNNSGRDIYSDGGVSGGNLTNVLIDSNAFVTNSSVAGSQIYEGALALESRTLNSQSNITFSNNVEDGVGKGVLIYNADNLTFTGNTITHTLDQWSGALRFEGGDTHVLISGNTIYDNTGPGVAVDSKALPMANSGFVLKNNNFYNNNTVYGNKLSVVVDGTTYNGTFDARNNWWGDASGPGGDGTGSGATVYGNGLYAHGSGGSWSTLPGGNVIFSPWSTAPNGTERAAYWGAPASDGAPIQVEDYDQGGEGIAYHDLDKANNGGKYRTAEGVDLEACTDAGGGYNVGWTAAGEWLGYTVNLTQSGTFRADFRVADGYALGGTFHLQVDGQNVTGAMTVPATGGWQNWQTISKAGINLAAGVHDMRIVFDTNGTSASVGNFNWFQLTNTTPSPLPGTPTNLAAVATGASSVNLTWTDASTNQTGVKIERSVDGVNFTQIALASATATSYTDTTPVAGTSYSYRVVATNGAGDSAPSNSASVVMPMIPAAPTNLAATALSATQVNLTWTDNAPGTEAGFIIQRSADGINFSQIGIAPRGVATYSDTSTTANVTYTYRVAATNLAGASAYSNTASATTPAVTATTTYLSDMNWVSATAGWGSVQKNATVVGNTITLKGVTYAKGLGTHAASQIVYNLQGGFSSLQSDVGIDDEEAAKGQGSVDFQVIGDGKILFDSGVLTNASPTISINVNVTGVQQLTLLATNGIANNIDYDHADWAGARLVSSATPALPAAPSNLTAVAASPSQINLNWTNNAISATGFLIERGTDGINFAQIGATAGNVTHYQDTGLTAGSGYFYRVRAANAGGDSTYSNLANAVTPSASAITTYLSDLPWVSATAGWGTVQKDTSIAGNPITLNGVTYAKGLGTHASSQIVYNLAGKYTNFLSDIGIDSEEAAKGQGSVDFQVFGDGKLLFDSGLLTNSSPTMSINLNVTGVQQLTLIVNNGIPNIIDYDHADWAGARLLSVV